MLYEKNKQQVLEKELFENPTSEYRGTPFWSWNTKVTKELVEEQIDDFKKMGMGGMHLHPRTGLETPYMSDEYLELVKVANEKAKANKMLCWLYDEDRYPSGAAGGMVTEDMRYRARYMLLSRDIKPEMCQSKEVFDEEIKKGEKPIGYYITSYQVVLEDGYLSSYARVSKEEEPEEGAIWHAYLRLTDEDPWYNDQTYLDVFNKQAVERFIEVTHQRYYEVLGDDFGKSIPAIFTDEPQMRGKFSLPFAKSMEDATLSFTDDMPQTFEEVTGVNLLDIIPEILWELPRQAISVHRYKYHDHLAERFASAFSDTLANWCEEHNIALTGHYMSERNLFTQTYALSEAMRLYRNQQIPGIDILCDHKEFTTAKQAVSVARQMGREAASCEMYGVMHWDCTFKQHKLQGDWLAALGITVRVHHLQFMSMEGEAKRDWPASIGYQSPWYEKYAYVEDHFARVNTVLTRGKAVVRVGVIHPIESFWISYGPNDQTQDIREQLDTNYESLMQWLLYGTIDFDLISESILAEMEEDYDEGFSVGEVKYSVILVPDCRTIRRTTFERLKKFAKAGGKVVFAGKVPKLIDALPSEEVQAFAKEATVIAYNRAEILDVCKEFRDVEIRKRNAGVHNTGKLSDNLFYQMRKDKENSWLFISHVNAKKNILDAREDYTIRIKGIWNIEVYETISGKIQQAEVYHEKGYTLWEKGVYAHDSLLLKLTATTIEMKKPIEKEQRKWQSEIIFRKADKLTTSEANMFLLDYAKYRVNEGEIQEEKEILQVDNEVREILGFPRRQDRFTQPWRIANNPNPSDKVELFFEFDSAIEVEGALLAIERPEVMQAQLNGVHIEMKPIGWYVDKFIKTVSLPVIKKGKNVLKLMMAFDRKSNIENLFILGKFDVSLWGERKQIEAFTSKCDFGDVTRQGLPFYTGNLHYEFSFEAEEVLKDAVIEVPHFEGTALEVFVDGKGKGMIAYAPHQLEIGTVEKGVHTLEIILYGNRYNGFGTLHNYNTEFMWYGPDSYRTSGSQWSDSYQLHEMGIISRVELRS